MVVRVIEPERRFEFLIAISKKEGFNYVLAVNDMEADIVYGDEESPRWTNYEDLPIDLRISLSEETWEDTVDYSYQLAEERWPMSKEEKAKLKAERDEQIKKELKEAEEAGELKEITIAPLQKLVKENMFNICKNIKSFGKSWDYILEELMEIYGDEYLVNLLENVWFDFIDEEFMVDGKSIMRSVSQNQFNKKMTKAMDRLLHSGLVLRAAKVKK